MTEAHREQAAPTGSDAGGGARRSSADDAVRAERIAVAAHEIRAPLTVIRGYLDLLGRGLPPEKHAQAVRGAQAAMQRVEAALDDLLDAAREGMPVQSTFSSEPLSIRSLAQEVAAEFATVTGRDITVSGASAGESRVIGDAARLRQVLANLVGNAVLHAPEGAIRLDVARNPEAGRVSVAVEDEGPGIAVEDRDAAFEPRERLGAADGAGRSVPGMGLGLTIARAVAEAHGGTLRFDDPTRGRGARVVLDLPAVGD